MRILRRMSLHTAVVMSISFYVLSIAIHGLVMLGVIPYDWVNGGRSASLSAQLPLSMVSVVVLLVGVVVTLAAGGKLRVPFRRSVRVMSWVFAILWIAGFFQQLAGTPFERFVVSLVLLLGVISSLRMAMERKV